VDYVDFCCFFLRGRDADAARDPRAGMAVGGMNVVLAFSHSSQVVT